MKDNLISNTCHIKYSASASVSVAQRPPKLWNFLHFGTSSGKLSRLFLKIKLRVVYSDINKFGQLLFARTGKLGMW